MNNFKKRKMSKKWENTVDFISAVAVVTVAIWICLMLFQIENHN